VEGRPSSSFNSAGRKRTCTAAPMIYLAVIAASRGNAANTCVTLRRVPTLPRRLSRRSKVVGSIAQLRVLPIPLERAALPTTLRTESRHVTSGNHVFLETEIRNWGERGYARSGSRRPGREGLASVSSRWTCHQGEIVKIPYARRMADAQPLRSGRDR
jgi:hypothetical protein